MRCEEPVKILEILRLTEQGYSQREIAKSVKCGKSTVGAIQKRCRDCSLQYDAAAQMTNDEIKRMLYPDSFGHPLKEDPDWPSINERLQTNKRLTLKQRFFSFEALNVEIQSRVKELVKRSFQKRKGSRRSVFEALDRPAIRPLPYTQFEYADYIVRRTPANYHVEYDGFHYSVPHGLYKQLVTLRATATTLEILNDNRERGP